MECRIKKANSYSVKVEFFIYGILCPPKHEDKMLWISINWPVARPKYEIHVVKISVSPEKKMKMDFF